MNCKGVSGLIQRWIGEWKIRDIGRFSLTPFLEDHMTLALYNVIYSE